MRERFACRAGTAPGTRTAGAPARTTAVARANAIAVWLLGNDQSPAAGQCATSTSSQQPRGCRTSDFTASLAA
ncbi:Uncharacterised protein [Mycobacteroides abscessus]|nr:Uncharacterised protein [Mycobacteroides abscessus]